MPKVVAEVCFGDAPEEVVKCEVLIEMVLCFVVWVALGRLCVEDVRSAVQLLAQ